MDAISCLALLPTSYTDAAIVRALHFSSTTTSFDSSASSSLSHHHHSPLLSALADLPSPYYAPPPHTATCCDSVLVADSPGRQNHALAPAGARAGKRRSRASKRAPTTYISTDPANFRLMVQQITGVQADAAGVELMMLQVQASAPLGAAAAGNRPQLLPAGDEASALRQHQLQLQLQQQQPCFPTLDSWNVMYETNSAEML